ncbi:MAG: efflux RND transporter periplasmic adaptor subunit [Clostridiales Family XIII bacterium]|jgi:RND family efflux transporter MFP subunit|nr:efflux RND transporter periplasmic adaptor subunit [Clostridiales Family XIII bacterium]
MDMYAERDEKPGKAGLIFKWLFFILVLGLIALAALRLAGGNAAAPPEGSAEKIVNVKVAVVERTDVTATITVTGRLEALDEASVMPKIPGQVTRVYVEMGQRVRKGQTLFTIDGSQARNTVKQAERTLSDAKTDLDRTARLHSEGAVPAQTYEQAKSAYDAALQAYDAAASAMGDYSAAAPISGYVTSVNIAAGSIASQASPAVTISDTGSLVINAGLSESLINKISLGDAVDVMVKSASDRPYKGAVTSIAPAPLPGSLTYSVKIALDNGDASLKPGMFAEVGIASESAKSVLAVPTRAVIVRAGRQVAVTLGADGAPKVNDVSIGVDDGEKVEIKSGLSEGEKVVVEGQNYVDSRSKVKVIP